MNIEEQAKFEHIFRTMFPKVKNFAFSILKSDTEAEDIAQDVFVKILKSPEMWNTAENLSSYIYVMMRNLIFNHLKHKKTENRYLSSFMWPETATTVDPDINRMYAREMELLTMLTVKNMPEQRQKIFRMSRFEHLSHAEIAEKLGLSVRTVERHIYLALNDLKKVLLAFIMFCWLQ